MTEEVIKTRKPLRMRTEPIPEGKHLEHHLIVRTIVPLLQGNPAAGKFTVEETDDYIDGYLRDGWEIVNTHFVANSADGIVFAWILVR